MEAHIFDINALIEFDSKVWIVDKNNPKVPLIKIDVYEYKLIKSGIYKKFNNIQSFGGIDFYITDELNNMIRVKCIKNNININDLYFSHAEFTDTTIPKKFKLIDNYTSNIKYGSDIYLLCSKNTQENYSSAIDSIHEHFNKLGFEIISTYNLTESFHNKDKDSISYKKTMIILQHLLGRRIVKDEMLTKIREYDKITYYDNSIKSIENIKNINLYLNTINDVENMDLSNKEVIAILTTNNKVNPFNLTKTKLKTDKIKRFK